MPPPDDDTMNESTASRLAAHTASCDQRYKNITDAISGLRDAQKALFESSRETNATLNRTAGKVAIIEAIMLALLALGIYEVLIRPVFQ